jgi:hypothetical protein
MSDAMAMRWLMLVMMDEGSLENGHERIWIVSVIRSLPSYIYLHLLKPWVELTDMPLVGL